MGIGGHILGERKLRGLRERTGLDLDRAYRRGRECEGRVVEDGVCCHYIINWESGFSMPYPDAMHWASCPPREEP